jgi:16S rRNA (uracil1498-N3)-methyltransferase
MQRLFLRHELNAGAIIELDRTQTNYLTNVLRMKAGAGINVFNGEHGEWSAVLVQRGRRDWALAINQFERNQTEHPDLQYLFAPLKQARLDYMVQKAVELGVGRLTPVLTQHGQINRVNLRRMQSNAMEAAEQCGLLTIPSIDEPIPLTELLDSWLSLQPDRRIVFCDETEREGETLAALKGMSGSRFAVLIGPEGGFSNEERNRLVSNDFVTSIGMGPRIMRADTAAVAAITLVQAIRGDWIADAG